MPGENTKRPRYVESQPNKDGTERWYWRPKDQEQVALGHDRFLAWQKAEALNLERDARRTGAPGARNDTGTVGWLVRDYLASEFFLRKAEKTQHEYRRMSKWLTDDYGELPCSAITPPVVQQIKQTGSKTPWETNARLRLLSLIYEWGRKQGRVGSNPAEKFGQLATPPRTIMWSPDECATLLAEGTPSIRLAATIGLYTLQRECDVLPLGWPSVAGGRFELRQAKTSKIVASELHPTLAAALAATPKKAFQIVVCESTGKAYGEDHFRHVFAYDRAWESAVMNCKLEARAVIRAGGLYPVPHRPNPGTRRCDG